MKNNNRATSLVEVLVSMVILVLWITWTYNIYFRTMHLSESSKNRLTAIEMAREWIEAVTNIRDTNWLNYWADYKNCWNVLNYNILCVNDLSSWKDDYDILAWSYILDRNDDKKWILTTKNTWNYTDTNYRTRFEVKLDTNWFYTQSGWTNINWPLFTREIVISYEDTNWWLINSNDEKMKIRSLVQWIDSSTINVQRVEFETILSNWKNRIN